MSEVVYNEDLVKRVRNKYLAVNIAAKRARDINASGLPLASPSAAHKNKKPVAIATQELVEGKLHFEKSEAKAPVENMLSIFTDPPESEDKSNMFFDEEYIPQETDADPEEREEGL